MLIDLSYEINEATAIYPGDPLYEMESVFSLKKGDMCNVSKLHLGTHTGTHMDAPLHFIDEGKGISDIPLEDLCGAVIIIDLVNLSSDLIEPYMLNNIEIHENDIVFFKTANSKRYKGTNVLDNFVGISIETAKFLVNKGVKMVGIDYMTIEKATFGNSSAHEVFLSNGVIIIEALDLRNVSAGRAFVYCFPIKIKNGDGCPVRVVLEIDHN